MQFPAFWFVENDVKVSYKFYRALVRDDSLGVRNDGALTDATIELGQLTGNTDGPWPETYPRPFAVLPDFPFAPDFWRFGSYDFASSRLREALAQPADVVQFLPFDLVRASPAAHKQDYRWMRVLIRQEALDMARCECEIEETTHAVTGKPRQFLSDIKFLALREDLNPRPEIFRVAESPSCIVATEAMASRVLRAGCSGMEFSHPENRLSGKRIERYRTDDGIGERRVGFLD